MNRLKKGDKEKSDFTSQHIYKYYKKTHEDPVQSIVYSSVIKKFNQRVIDKIYDGLIFSIPANLGFIGIAVSVTNTVFDDKGRIDMNKSNLSTDWGATNTLWKEVPELKHKKYIFHDNSHTNGRRFKIKWSREYTSSGAIYYYRFAPARRFQRNLAQYIKNNPNKEYYEF